MIFCVPDSDTGVPRGLTRSGIEDKDAFMPDCGVHCLWFAIFAALSVSLFFQSISFNLIRSPPPPAPSHTRRLGDAARGRATIPPPPLCGKTKGFRTSGDTTDVCCGAPSEMTAAAPRGRPCQQAAGLLEAFSALAERGPTRPAGRCCLMRALHVPCVGH